MANVLIIDDDEMMCDVLSQMVEHMGHEAKTALTLKDGLAQAAAGNFDMVFLDVRLPDGDGLSGLAQMRETTSEPEVIIITGVGDPDGAELAIKNGAWDYIQKPISMNDVTLSFLRALQHRQERKSGKHSVALKREGIIGNSPPMKACLDLLAQAASSEVNVLITGETGTGKELFAGAIHANSSRTDKNFVVVDCTALPETLVESVLFGYEKGAFTGADRAREGLVKQANGGTLFLDEVGELPLIVQKSFLRVLQEHRFRPLGSRKEVESDFWLISATNRDLDKMVRSGQFREDLLFRLRSFTIHLPPLREHPEDIKELTISYMSRLCDRHGIGTKGFAPEFFNSLEKYPWPGNVRELFNTLDRVFTVARNESILFPQHLPEHIRIQVMRELVRKHDGEMLPGGTRPDGMLPPLREYREAAVGEAERKYLQELLAVTKGNMKDACRISGLSLPRLYALVKKYHIKK